MALTAVLEYKTLVETEIIAIKAGALDVLYKGAIVNIGTDGFIKVAADAANEVTLGVMKEQVDAKGSNVEWCEVERGIIRVPHTGAAQTDVGALFHADADDTLDDGTGAAIKATGMCVGWEDGYLWLDFRMKTLGA